MDVRVRRARPEDTEAVRAVHGASILELGTEVYSQEQVDAWAANVDSADYGAIDAEEYYFVVAEVEGDGGGDGDGDREVGADGVVAFGSLELVEPDDYESAADAEVTGVYVHPDAAREGVGTAVLRDLEARARSEGVERLGLTASANAVPFYETHDYDRVTERTHEFSSSAGTGVEGRVVEMVRRL